MAIDAVQGGEHLKPETVEVLKELESEGHQIGEEPAKVEPVKTEEPKTAEPEAEPAKVEPPSKVEREVQAVPVKKYNEERHKRQEVEKRLAEAEAKLNQGKTETPEDIKSAATQFAQKYELKPEFVEELLDTATKLTSKNTQGLSPEEISALKQAKAVLDKQAEDQAFDADFQKTIAEMPDLAEHKDKIKQLAYTEGYTSTSLRAIALEYAHDNGLLTKGRKTLEKASAGRTVSTEAIDFDSLSEEQAKALPDDQWEKYVEHQIVKQKRAKGILN